MSRRKDMLGIIGWYREVTGKTEIDMHDVARFATSKGWEQPEPIDPIDRLARAFSRAAREQTKKDPVTGRPVRVNHAVINGQQTLWYDIDTAPRRAMHKALTQRREQVIGDVVQLTFDAEYWSASHPTEAPIEIQADFTPDVEWRKNAEPEEPEGEDPEMTKGSGRANDRSLS